MTSFVRLTLRTIGGLLPALLLVMSMGVAHAGSLSTSTLISLKVVEQSERETRFEMRFDPRVNVYASALDNAGTPVIAFSVTARGPDVAIPQGLNGLVRSVRFDENPTVLFIRFDTAARGAAITARSTADDTVLVTVSSANGAPSSGPPPGAPPGAPPPAQPGSAPPAESFADMGYEMVQLKYADVSEVVGLLAEGITVKPNDNFTPRSPGFGSAGPSGGAAYNPLPSPTATEGQAMGQSVSRNLALDRRLNAIWVRGDRQTIDRIKAQIAAIDVAVDSVMLETQLVELTEAGARSVGIDFANANGQIATATLTSGQYKTGGYGSYDPTGATFLKSASLQAALYAQIASGNGRILSRPRILAQSGASANIITGDAIPILTSITLSGVNGVSQQVQYVNVGVTLQIAPRVTSDGFVSSHIFCVVSSVTGYLQGYPTISQREAQTYATVRDGEAFVIGGLTQESAIVSHSRVPALGDVPILGVLAGVHKLNRSKTELYILVTPRIIRRLDLGSAGGRAEDADATAPVRPSDPVPPAAPH